MYICSADSIPIAVALMITGLTPGAALFFLWRVRPVQQNSLFLFIKVWTLDYLLYPRHRDIVIGLVCNIADIYIFIRITKEISYGLGRDCYLIVLVYLEHQRHSATPVKHPEYMSTPLAFSTGRPV